MDWDKLEQGIHGEAARIPRKSLRPHQREAMEKTHEYFKTADRGKLIMACGTGKTFNALRIAEHETEGLPQMRHSHSKDELRGRPGIPLPQLSEMMAFMQSDRVEIR